MDTRSSRSSMAVVCPSKACETCIASFYAILSDLESCLLTSNLAIQQKFRRRCPQPLSDRMYVSMKTDGLRMSSQRTNVLFTVYQRQRGVETMRWKRESTLMTSGTSYFGQYWPPTFHLVRGSSTLVGYRAPLLYLSFPAICSPLRDSHDPAADDLR